MTLLKRDRVEVLKRRNLRAFRPPLDRVNESRLRSVNGSTNSRAFTLIELLLVIAIMGLIAAMAVPALKSLGKSNVQAGAARQMLDDIGRARQLAISQHTTVYMVFVPTNFFNLVDNYGGNIYSDLNSSRIPVAADLQLALATMTNLVDKQLTGYNFISYGKVGDQPGQHAWHYLADWQNLPDGTFVATEKFLPQWYSTVIPNWQSDYAGKLDSWYRSGGTLYPQLNGFAPSPVAIPFPTEKSPSVYLPCLIFDSTGKLISETQDNVNFHHAYIPLAQGSVGWGHDINKLPTLTVVQPGDVTEIPPGNSTGVSYNIIDVDPLSGRAHLMVHPLP